ncbi:amidohydrolase family protein [Arenicella xantha]|uniref:Amidohydrolase family protein n=1 Tax=Arenicella xantha TaxID=644221 RepID=A0A395JGJ2_9GAMM|nr:amidohydrolase family protein [Arenicella xantha]RBP48491.1 amidohydrolase family protein [Arenicella xantha]
MKIISLFAITFILSSIVLPANAADTDAALFARISDDIPKRQHGEGQYDQLIIRGAFLIDGTGAPATGPVDVVVERDRIVEVRTVGTPGIPIKADYRPAAASEAGKTVREIDAHGKYLMPGFVDSHSHIHTPSSEQAVSADYIFKLWMGHGITSVREVFASGGESRLLALKELSNRNAITAPRITAFPFFGLASDGDTKFAPIVTPKDARNRVQHLKRIGADGIKFLGAREDILWAALDEAEKVGLGTTMHHAQLDVVHANVLDTSSRGLDCMEHWYGLPEALFTDKVVQNYPSDYIYSNEQDRFGQAGRLWKQAAGPGTERWNEVMDALLERDFCLSPTFTIYLASRDLMRAYTAEWHYQYTSPALWEFYRANREKHGSFFFNWTTEDEVAWKHNYAIWMQFVNEYKNRGGKVVVGSDTGYIYSLYGFGYIQELELLQEAGFHPLEVIRAATKVGAEVLGKESDIGTIHVGKKADMIIVDENPLHNLKSLYGTGVPKLNEQTQKVERVGGVRWTIKDGIVYDAQALLAEVRAMVRASKQKAGLDPDIPMTVEQ